MAITYVPMTKQDHKDIKRLITEAWFSDYPFKEKYIKLYASGYLNMYLSHSDYKMVAKDGDKVVGFLFGNIKKEDKLISRKLTYVLSTLVVVYIAYKCRKTLKQLILAQLTFV